MALHVWASIVGRAHEHEATEHARETKVATRYGWRVPVERVEVVIYELTMNWQFANIAIDGSAGIGLPLTGSPTLTSWHARQGSDAGGERTAP